MPPSSHLRPPLLDELTKAALALALERHPDQIAAVAENISRFGLTLEAWPQTARSSELEALLERSSGATPDFVAGLLLGAAQAASRIGAKQRVEMVWTGPSSALVPSRRTEQVLLGIISGAKSRLFLTTFVASHADHVFVALDEASKRGVDVSVLLEEKPGPMSENVVAHFRAHLPLATLYYWDRADHYGAGKVHAKATVADGQVCLVTSANLTGYAMEKNMEIGVLVSGGDMPTKLLSHLDSLISTRVLRELRSDFAD